MKEYLSLIREAAKDVWTISPVWMRVAFIGFIVLAIAFNVWTVDTCTSAGHGFWKCVFFGRYYIASNWMFQ